MNFHFALRLVEAFPSWDLFVVVFFIVILAYSIMIGKDQTIKIILASYISILASDGLGSIGARILEAVSQTVRLPEAFQDQFVILAKIGMFVAFILLLATRGAFEIVMADEKSIFMRVMTTGIYGVLSAGLIISTILMYVSGASLVGGESIFAQNPLLEVAEESRAVKIMLDNYAFWFALPAAAFVISSLFTSED